MDRTVQSVVDRSVHKEAGPLGMRRGREWSSAGTHRKGGADAELTIREGTVELRHFRYFVAVAEERHFGRAAERLMIAQPGLSQQIKSLERALGVVLLVRDRRGAQLTPAGEHFLRQARLVLELADRTVEDTVLIGRGKTGVLKIGIGAEGILPLGNEVLRRFRAQHANVDVRVFPGFGPTIVEDLNRRSLDAAILLAPFDSPEVARFLPLGRLELLVALPAGHRLSDLRQIPRSELRREPFLDWPRTSNPRLHAHLREALFGVAGHPNLTDVTEAPEAGRMLLVARGDGITVTTFPPELEPASVVFRRLEHPVPVLDYGVAWFDTNASELVPSFVEVARSIAQPRDEGSRRDTADE